MTSNSLISDEEIKDRGVIIASPGYIGRHIIPEALKDKRIVIVSPGHNIIPEELKFAQTHIIDTVDMNSLMKESNIYTDYIKYDRAPLHILEYDGGTPKYQRKLLVKIDILKEYKLIQEKKSTLTKWEREEIIKLVKTII